MALSFPRGETIAIAAQIVMGSASGVSTAEAALRPALATDATTVDPSQSAAARFTTALQAAASDGSYPAWYLLTLSASSCAALPIGNYLTDLRLTFSDGTIWISAPVQITITEPATVS